VTSCSKTRSRAEDWNAPSASQLGFAPNLEGGNTNALMEWRLSMVAAAIDAMLASGGPDLTPGSDVNALAGVDPGRSAIWDQQAVSGEPSVLTPEEVKKAEAWLRTIRVAVVKIYDTNGTLAPWNSTVRSATVSATERAFPPRVAGDNVVYATEGGGHVGDITIYPEGARSFDEMFVVFGHEMAHFFDNTWSEDERTAYGRGLLNVYKGGTYNGPMP
jgi:hypothetical protein